MYLNFGTYRALVGLKIDAAHSQARKDATLHGLGFRVEWLRVLGLGFRVQGVLGLGFRDGVG